MCDLEYVTIRVWVHTTLSSSPSDLMTRLCQRGWCLACSFFPVTCLLFVLHISSHNTLHRGQMSHVPKKRACDRRLARLISDFHNTSDHRQCCPVGVTAQYCRLGLFRDSDFAWDFEDSNSTSGEFCVPLGVELSLP